MTKHYILKGDVVIWNDNKWLVLDVSSENYLLVKLETTQLNIKKVDSYFLEDEIRNNSAEFLGKSEPDEVQYEGDYGAAAIINRRNRTIASYLLKQEDNLFWLANRFKLAKFVHDMATEFGTCKNTIRRFLSLYLQNNLCLNGIGCKYYNCGGRGKEKNYSNGKRPGRKGISQVVRTDEVVEQLETFRLRFIRAKGCLSFVKLYNDFCSEFYSSQCVQNGELVNIPYAAVHRPSLRQFLYYMKCNLSESEIYTIKNGRKKAKNNIRALHKDTISDLEIKSIGSRFEIDETETDFYLVSSINQNQPIGRAVLYFVVDVFSRMIVGFYVGLDNNSWAGAEMVLLNVAENKAEVCSRAGIAIQESEWPAAGYVPTQLQMDNGAEYVSFDLEKFAIENGIRLAHVESQMGSFKPNVEQKFHQFHTAVKGRLPGEIVKDKYGQPHITQARMTLEDMQKVVIEFILYYNKTPMEDYPLTKEMLTANLIPSPLNIWNFELKKPNGLKRILDFSMYKFSLLSEGKASITREGIIFRKKIYTCDNLEWLSHEMRQVHEKGRKKLNVRYDKRNTDYIHFIVDGKIVKGWLNEDKSHNDKYKGMGEADVLAVNQQLKLQSQAIDQEKLKNRMIFEGKIKKISKDANRRHHGKNVKKNIHESRKEEMMRHHKAATLVIETENQNRQIPQINPLDKPISPTWLELQSLDPSKLTTYDVIRLNQKIELEVKTQNYRIGNPDEAGI